MTKQTAPNRRGVPSPLIMHLASAAELLEAGARLAPLAASPRFPWATPPTTEDRGTAKAIAAAPGAEMAIALRLEAATRLSDMLRGVRMYQDSPHHRTLVDPPVIWQKGTSRLLDYGTGAPGALPVLVAPSLINSFHILDLDDGCSLMRWLAETGLRPILLDWGAPGAEEQGFSLTDYLEHRLIPAFDHVRMLSNDRRASVLGYCMGGTLSVALAALRRGDVRHLALMGAPWDFAHMRPMRSALAALGVSGDKVRLSEQIDSVSSAFGAVPVTALQAVFAQLDPGLAARKFRRFAGLPAQSASVRKFVLLEDWLNAGPPLSGPAAREALLDWHLDNVPGQERWMVETTRIAPEVIAAPTLIVAARTDNITPPGATEALAVRLKTATVLKPASGHVGMVVSSNARQEMWQPLADFLQSTA